MPKIHLTDLAVQKLGPGLHFDAKTPAFGIQVGAHRKTWVVIKGANRTKIGLGQYPEVSLKEAHRKALLELGSPAVQAASMTFPNAKDAFLEQDKWRPATRRVLVSSLKHFPWTKTLAKLTHEDVRVALEAIEHPSARAHALKDIRSFFNWCIPRYLATSPCAGIKMESQSSRERVLSDDELKRVWAASADMGYPFGTIVQLLILTGQRRSEIGKLDWSYIGGDRITLPASLVKNGREHVFPLAPLAKSLLPKAGVGPVFLATGSDEIIYAGFAYHLPKLQALSETKDWTLHDLRRTFATNLAAMGTPIHVTEKILNHVSGSISGVAAIYNRHAYFDEMRAALEAWETKVRSLSDVDRLFTRADRPIARESGHIAVDDDTARF